MCFACQAVIDLQRVHVSRVFLPDSAEAVRATLGLPHATIVDPRARAHRTARERKVRHLRMRVRELEPFDVHRSPFLLTLALCVSGHARDRNMNELY